MGTQKPTTTTSLATTKQNEGPRAAQAPPIKWHPFTQESFLLAKNQQKLVVVTVETTWCHWCHVMEERVWPDEEIRQILDEKYISIRVNADENPEVGERFAAWGWPATAILDGDGNQLVAVRGYKHVSKFRALFHKVFAGVKSNTLEENLKSLSFLRAKRRSAQGRNLQEPEASFGSSEERLWAQLDGFYDEEKGGWGRPQKYPLRAPILLSLLRDDGEKHRFRAQYSLEGYAELQDSVAGGVFQYSVAGDWQHPHTEKLGHLQAEMIQAFLDGEQAGFIGLRQEAEQVATYVLAVLKSESGAFYANQDADVREGEKILLEGPKYYLLDEKAREAYVPPPVEKNIYASHNGALIEALMRLFQAHGDERWRLAAESALLDVEKKRRKGLGYAHDEDLRLGRFLLEDQVFMLRAYLAHYLATGDGKSRERLIELAYYIIERFSLDDGGMRALLDEKAPAFMRGRMPFQTNAKLAETLFILARLDASSDDDKTLFRKTAERQLELLSLQERSEEEGRTIGNLLLAYQAQREIGLHISVVGGSVRATAELRKAALRLGGVGTLVEHSDIGLRFGDLGKPAAFVCSSSSCSMPAFDVGALEEIVKRERQEER